MYLLDSNIIIYSYLPQYQYLRDLFFTDLVFVSEISRLEVLGYHMLTENEQIYFNYVFQAIQIILPAQEIFDKSIELRKAYNMKLGDSIIAATASVHALSIYTRNIGDFEKLDFIDCINPIQ